MLAPLLMMGGALGGMEAMFLPHEGIGFWPLVSMGAILGGTMRSPLTGIIFALELTHDVNMLAPLLLAVTIAHGFTVLTLRRSILTEKVARRGYHLSREYAVDPLELLVVREVMRTNIVALSAKPTIADLGGMLNTDRERKGQLLISRCGRRSQAVGLDRHTQYFASPFARGAAAAYSFIATGRQASCSGIRRRALAASGGQRRMAESGYTRFPVVDREDNLKLVGMVALHDLLQARTRTIQEERRRECVLRNPSSLWAAP